MQETEFEIDRDAARNYFVARWILSCVGVLGVFVLPFVPVFFAAIFATIIGTIGMGPPASFFSLFSSFILFSFAIVPPLAVTAVGVWLCPQQANNLRYRLEGSTVRADGGVFFLFRKSIPLERITDVALVQGPLLRYFGIWAMRIQTAGSVQCEATLYGVRNPEEVRELILSQRQRIYGEKAAEA